MISQSNNRVQAIKNKFEKLNHDDEQLLSKSHISRKDITSQLFKQESNINNNNINKELYSQNVGTSAIKDNNYDCKNQLQSHILENKKEVLLKPHPDVCANEIIPEPNISYLYTKTQAQKSGNDIKKQSLSRQSSDPGKKLHRSHAFRCDKSQKIINHSPKRHGSCKGRSESSDFSVKTVEKPKLSKDRLRMLSNLLENQMRKENFGIGVDDESVKENVPFDSIPDEEVPKHILDQYAKVLKPKKIPESSLESKPDLMTDSGVSSETENLEESTEKISKLKHIKSQFETAVKTDETNIHLNGVKLTNKSNLELMNEDELCSSSETMRLVRINPHIDLTDTLKKALKQPLPAGPPPKKPPRTFLFTPSQPDLIKIEKRKDTKQMLEKLEQVLQEREIGKSPTKNIYDVAETDLSPKSQQNKEVHYLCTEILDITNRTLLPNSQKDNDPISSCFNSLNCAIVPTQSTTSLPYTRLSTGSIINRNSIPNLCCSCSVDSLNNIEENKPKLTTFFSTKPTDNMCKKCHNNLNKIDRFQCHLNCKCKESNSEFFVQKEHIYDEPNVDEKGKAVDIMQRGVVRKSIGVECQNENRVVNTTNKGDFNNSENVYGTLKSVKLNGIFSKSLEDLKYKKSCDLVSIYFIFI